MAKRWKKERWVKNIKIIDKDNRNWKEYNEELIHRGELYLSLEFIKN